MRGNDRYLYAGNSLFLIAMADKNNKKITQREMQVLLHIDDGKSSKEIAVVMKITVRTVETHRRNLNGKLGANGSASLLHQARLRKLLD